MVRTLFAGLLATIFCSLQSGCCCCRLPFAIRGGGPPVVFNPPPVVVQPPPPVNQPPVNNPPVNNPPPNQPPQRVIVKYQYNLSTGQLTQDGRVIGTGFSGKGASKNDQESYKERITGVIPPVDWRVEGKHNDPNTGEPILDLKLHTGGPVPGRVPVGENFTIHAENSPNAGESGIAMPRNVRDAIPLPKGPFDLTLIEVRTDPNAPPKTKIYTYSQRSGQLKLGNELIGVGYSGKDKGKNNPVMQKQPNLGPVPRGEYAIIGRFPDQRNGGFKLKTQPMAAKTYNRYPAEEFWIAPETNPPGSHPASYIVFPREVFDRIDYRENVRTLLKVGP